VATRQRTEKDLLVERCAKSGLLQSGLAQRRSARAAAQASDRTLIIAAMLMARWSRRESLAQSSEQ
jgi:hypothetical protein